MTAKKEGKSFEEDFKQSCEKQNIDITRFNDGSAGNFIGEETEKKGLRFTPANLCDFVIFDGELLLFCELKTTCGTSINFADMKKKICDKNAKVKTGKIKYKQLIGLFEKDCRKNKQINNIAGGFMLNFRKQGRTYYLSATKFLNFILSTDKKSINISDLEELKAIYVTREKKISRYTYDIKSMMRKIKEEINERY